MPDGNIAFDPEVASFAAGRPRRPAFDGLSPDAARRLSNEFLTSVSPGPDIGTIVDHRIGDRGLLIRTYSPRDAPAGLIVYFHGGGFVLGSVDVFDGLCRRLVDLSAYAVMSVDYRLAPEHPFPCALDDAREALAWAVQAAPDLGLDPRRVVVMGDSAGGGLAAVLARDAHAAGVALQVLVYPVLDCSFDTPSYHRFGAGFGLSADEMKWFWGHYANGADPRDPDLSPLRAPDLSGAAPAIIVTAEFDVLGDEAQSYGERLTSAGVEVDVSCAQGMTHGFLGLVNDVQSVRAVVTGLVAALRSRVG